MPAVKTFFDLRRQFLNEHHEKYCGFTRLLIVLSVAFITVLVSSMSARNPSLLVKASLVCQLLSLCCGLIVQHQIMHNPLRHLHQTKQAQARFLASEDQAQSQIEVRRTPSIFEMIGYKLQVVSFVTSFLLISTHFVRL